MDRFQTIFHRAANRHGGEGALHAKILEHHVYINAQPHLTDDRWLSEMTKRVFQSGFNWSVVENKWDGFESAFWKFDPKRCSEIDMEDMERLMSDKGIVRNPVKVKTVAKNAQMILDMAAQKGSADEFIRSWPMDDYVGLLAYLNKHGSHLGVNTAGYFLRFTGVPSFILSTDVKAALIHAGVIDGPVDKSVTSKRAKTAIQEAFNGWMDESGHDLTYISRALALSIDAG